MAWDITLAIYSGKSKDISSQIASPWTVGFKSDGTKMYVMGTGNLYQYSLSSAWDVSTASYDSISASFTTQDSAPRNFRFKPDGTSLYIVGLTNKKIFQYSLSSAWDISTASYSSLSISVNSEDTEPRGVAFKTDGSKMYIVGGTNDTVYQYSLSSAWDVSTASYSTLSKSVTSENSEPRTIVFSSDGLKMFLVGGTSGTVYQYSLSSAWDISSASYGSNNDTSSQTSWTYGIEFNSDGSIVYFCSPTNALVYEYNIQLSTTGNFFPFFERIK